jgi:transglutaminase-like putative cysteine protease
MIEAMDNRRLLIGCEFTYVATIATPVVFQVVPVDSPQIAIEGAQWGTDPALAIRGYLDLYGNPCVRAVLPPGKSTFRYGAVAVVPDATEEADEDARECAPDELPDDTLVYTLPSRYCLPDVLGGEAWSRFGALPPGYRRVQAICDYVNGHLTFQ